jgi:hypothetical protein
MLHCVSCDSGWHAHVYSTTLSHTDYSLVGGLLSAHSVIKKNRYYRTAKHATFQVTYILRGNMTNKDVVFGFVTEFIGLL